MKFKIIISFAFLFSISGVYANTPADNHKNLNIPASEIINTDSLFQSVFSDSIKTPKVSMQAKAVAGTVKGVLNKSAKPAKNADLKVQIPDSLSPSSLAANYVPVKIDSLLLLANPFFIDLVYKGLPFDINVNFQPDLKTLFYGYKASTLSEEILKPTKVQSVDQIITELRNDARDEITKTDINLYSIDFDELPDPDTYKNHYIKVKPINNVRFSGAKELNPYIRRLIVRREHIGPWQHKETALAQFSQNYISPNWYQGGNSNLAMLGIVTAQLNYDNKKSIQWENSAEWHMGFNTNAGDTLHMISTNDDIFKINSKLGVKAGGNWFYSGSVDFSTQFFNSYNGINSNVMKTSFLTPIRLNIGVGMDYKYKKIFSIMLSPVTYNYIYMSDTKNVNPNLFGIKTGENMLSQIGSSFKATCSYPLTKEIHLDSNLSFFTNYQKMQIDWEIVCNMTINRFMSTRISFNPRYDNTVIETNGAIAKMQFKQLISVGFSHNFN